MKPTLLFIHGFRGNHLGLGGIVKYFEKQGYTCYAPDIPPAFNTSDEELPELADYSAAGYAKWIADYIAENKLEKPILIGHSMGSIISAATANFYPKLINEKIFFLAPICSTPPSFICRLTPFVTFLPNKLIGYITTKYLIIQQDREIFKQTLDITYKCSEKVTSRKDVKKAAKFSTKYAISDFNFKKKCIFIAGEKDRLNTQEQVNTVAKKFNGETVFIDDTGHLLNYEEPFKLAKTIEKYLDPLS